MKKSHDKILILLQKKDKIESEMKALHQSNMNLLLSMKQNENRRREINEIIRLLNVKIQNVETKMKMNQSMKNKSKSMNEMIHKTDHLFDSMLSIL